MLCLQTPQCLSLWVGPGRPSRQLRVPLVQTVKMPGRGRKWFIARHITDKNCPEVWTRQTNTENVRGLPVPAARLWQWAKGSALWGRHCASQNGSWLAGYLRGFRLAQLWRYLPVSAFPGKKETFRNYTVYHTSMKDCVCTLIWNHYLSLLPLLLLLLSMLLLWLFLLIQIQSDSWCVDYRLITHACN